MKVRISDISALGLNIRDNLPLGPLNTRLNQGAPSSITFLEAPIIELGISRSAYGADVNGRIQTRYKQACARCNEPLEQTLEVEVDLVLKESRATTLEEKASEPKDELGVLYYDQDQVDLEDYLQESVIVALSPFWSPPCAKDGACEVCGLKLTQLGQNAPPTDKNSFGELLKKAGLK